MRFQMTESGDFHKIEIMKEYICEKVDNCFTRNIGSWIIAGDTSETESIRILCPHCGDSASIVRTKGSHTVLFTRYCPSCGKEVCRKNRESNNVTYTKRQIVQNIQEIIKVVGVKIIPVEKPTMEISFEQKEALRKELSCILSQYIGNLIDRRTIESLRMFLSGYVRGVFERITGKSSTSYNKSEFDVDIKIKEKGNLDIKFPSWFPYIYEVQESDNSGNF